MTNNEYLKVVTGREPNNDILAKIKAHSKTFNITEKVCAWYKDMKDFYSDWCDKTIGFTKTEARALYKEGLLSGEFQRIKNYGILRYSEMSNYHE